MTGSAWPAEPPHPAIEPRSQTFIAGDPLRAVAALSVVVFHLALFSAAAHGGESYGQADRLLFNLSLGLYVFFVLSGYLLSLPFVRMFADGRPPPEWAPYLRNRALRIVPAFWATIIVGLVFFGARGSSPGEILAVFGFAQIYAPSGMEELFPQTWTLDVEIVFYVMLPVGALLLTWLAGRLDHRARLWAVVAIAVVAYVLSVGVRTLGSQTEEASRMPWAMLFAFVPGILLSVAHVGLADRLRGSRRAGVVSWLLWPVASFVMVAGAAGTTTDDVAARGVLVPLATGLVVAAALLRQWASGDCWRILDNAPMRWVGERSYGLYLVHVLAYLAIEPLVTHASSAAAGFAVGLPVTLALSLVAAALLHVGVEIPFLRLRARCRQRPATERVHAERHDQ